MAAPEGRLLRVTMERPVVIPWSTLLLITAYVRLSTSPCPCLSVCPYMGTCLSISVCLYVCIFFCPIFPCVSLSTPPFFFITICACLYLSLQAPAFVRLYLCLSMNSSKYTCLLQFVYLCILLICFSTGIFVCVCFQSKDCLSFCFGSTRSFNCLHM